VSLVEAVFSTVQAVQELCQEVYHARKWKKTGDVLVSGVMVRCVLFFLFFLFMIWRL
jgi:hypothetical protein